MRINWIKRLSLIAVLCTLVTGFVFAEPYVVPVKKFEFEAVTNTESVIINYNDDAYLFVYDTPNKTFRYLMSEVKSTSDTGYESISFTGTDLIMGSEVFVMITKSENFTDIRIGNKIIKFKVLRKYSVEYDEEAAE